MLRRGLQVIAEVLFPTFCMSCNTEGELWCDVCSQNKAQLITWSPLTENANAALDTVSALFLYKESNEIARCIQALKYQYQTSHRGMWERLLTYQLQSDFTCIPVPLHPRRLRERGFNQAAYLASIISHKHKLNLRDEGLKRVLYTKQQAKLNRAARLRNVSEAFECNGGEVPRKVYLIDDVYTTGATMEACARVLKAAGAERVEGLVIARD